MVIKTFITKQDRRWQWKFDFFFIHTVNVMALNILKCVRLRWLCHRWYLEPEDIVLKVHSLVKVAPRFNDVDVILGTQTKNFENISDIMAWMKRV